MGLAYFRKYQRTGSLWTTPTSIACTPRTPTPVYNVVPLLLHSAPSTPSLPPPCQHPHSLHPVNTLTPTTPSTPSLPPPRQHPHSLHPVNTLTPSTPSTPSLPPPRQHPHSHHPVNTLTPSTLSTPSLPPPCQHPHFPHSPVFSLCFTHFLRLSLKI